MTYDDWIAENVKDSDQAREVTERMAADFPELIRVHGYYRRQFQLDIEHWWLVSPFGDVIDPIAAWLPLNGQYEPWSLSTRRCPVCGAYIYHTVVCYSNECQRIHSVYVTQCAMPIEEELRKGEGHYD